ncbi:hypothetical protein [Niveibacterium sp. SC-1]|uniref:hypothetical protein n=1 Tax=Niveibacterium sp. SC-1 TaxID=3135646 RepID=UPI00311E77C2
MSVRPPDHAPRFALPIAILASVLVHVVALVWRMQPPTKPTQPPGRLTARLAAPPKVTPPRPTPSPPTPPTPPAKPEPSPVARAEPPPPTPPAKRRLLTRREAEQTTPSPKERAAPKFSVREKEDMDRFLDSLKKEQKEQEESGPSLAERALADARSIARERPAARGDTEDDSTGPISVERIPGSPDISPFSLEMYLDGLVNKLNRSSAFVKRNGRSGLSKAAAELKINPDGSIGGFEVLAMGDQHDEIAYIDKLVHRAAPYSAFPPDIAGSARSMRILICVIPAGEGGVGFTRQRSGRGC